MTEFSDLLLVGLLGGLIANAIELPIIWWISRPDRLLKRLSSPSPKDKKILGAFFNNMLDLFLEPSIPQGKKVKVEVSPDIYEEVEIKDSETGRTRFEKRLYKPAVYKMQDEFASPLDMLVERIGTDMLARMQGWTGSIKRDLGRAAKVEGNWSMIAQSLTERMLPHVDAFLDERLKSRIPPTI
jgi:hypothetical protein